MGPAAAGARLRRVLAPSYLWGRLPRAFLSILISLGAFQSRRYPVDTVLRSLVSIRIAQLNGCRFCVDLNSHNFLRAAEEHGFCRVPGATT